MSSSRISSATQIQEAPNIVTIQLRAKEEEKRVSWSEDTINNEGMGKKSSKKCCIFHKKRAFGESSSEEESDSSDSDFEEGAKRRQN